MWNNTIGLLSINENVKKMWMNGSIIHSFFLVSL
jgi:hypothetical protein